MKGVNSTVLEALGPEAAGGPSRATCWLWAQAGRAVQAGPNTLRKALPTLRYDFFFLSW